MRLKHIMESNGQVYIPWKSLL